MVMIWQTPFSLQVLMCIEPKSPCSWTPLTRIGKSAC